MIKSQEKEECVRLLVGGGSSTVSITETSTAWLLDIFLPDNLQVDTVHLSVRVPYKNCFVGHCGHFKSKPACGKKASTLSVSTLQLVSKYRLK